MKKLTLTFNEEEYLVLTRMLFMAQSTFLSFEYDDIDTVHKIYGTVCEKGFHELPETNFFEEMQGDDLTPFAMSLDMYDEMEVLTDLAELSVLQEHLPYSLADRDFVEKHGKLASETIVNDPVLLADLKTLQAKYIEEFGKYGVTHLRLEER